MKKQKQQGIKKRLTKGFVKAAVIGAIAAMIGVVALLIAASQYEKALNRYGFTQGDIGKAMTAFSESRSALRAVVGYDEEAVIKKQTELHTEKKEAFNTYMEELDRTLRFDEGRTAYDEVLRALDGYWELDEQVLQLAISDDADGYLKAQELDTGDLTTQYENVYAQFVNLMNVCVEKGDRAEKNLRHMEFIMLIVILVIVISSFWSSVILGKKMAGDIEKPMVALADRLQSFAQGDLVSEFPECNTEDEIAYMIRVAKEMADNLNLIITDAGELLGQMADGNYAIGTKIGKICWSVWSAEKCNAQDEPTDEQYAGTGRGGCQAGICRSGESGTVCTVTCRGGYGSGGFRGRTDSNDHQYYRFGHTYCR